MTFRELHICDLFQKQLIIPKTKLLIVCFRLIQFGVNSLKRDYA